MKKILILLLVITPLLSIAQTAVPVTQGSKYYEFRNGVRVDSAFFHPRKDTIIYDLTLKAPGMTTVRPQDSLPYYFNGVKWFRQAFLSDIPSIGSFVENQNTSPQTPGDFWISGLGTADTLIGISGIGISSDWRLINSSGSWQLKHNPSGNIPLSTFGSSGIGVDGGIILDNGNFSMGMGGTIAPRYMEFTNFINANQLGTSTNHFLTYDPVSFRMKYVPAATMLVDYAPASGSANYINNQTLINQIADFKIAGSGYFMGTGNVGIGTASPSQYYHGGTSRILEIYNSGTVSNSQAHVVLSTANAADTGSVGTVSWMSNNTNNKGVAYIRGQTLHNTATQTWGALSFATSNGTITPLDRMLIDSVGRVGIGFAEPIAELNLLGKLNINGQLSYADNIHVKTSQPADDANYAPGLTIGTSEETMTVPEFAAEIGVVGDPTEANRYVDFGAVAYANASWAGSVSIGRVRNRNVTLGANIVKVLNTGLVGINTTPSSTLDINAANGYTQFRLRTQYTPSSSADSNGSAGDIAVDDNYIYFKTSTGWKRAALSTF